MINAMDRASAADIELARRTEQAAKADYCKVAEFHDGRMALQYRVWWADAIRNRLALEGKKPKDMANEQAS